MYITFSNEWDPVSCVKSAPLVFKSSTAPTIHQLSLKQKQGYCLDPFNLYSKIKIQWKFAWDKSLNIKKLRSSWCFFWHELDIDTNGCALYGLHSFILVISVPVKLAPHFWNALFIQT